MRADRIITSHNAQTDKLWTAFYIFLTARSSQTFVAYYKLLFNFVIYEL
jgi:hypothetical protein